MPTRKSTSQEPWEKPAPKTSRHTKLTPTSKAKAKVSAKKAGRSSPSLVDNMNAARKQRKSEPPKKQIKKKAAPTKDPKGGLTAAGRRHFAQKEGARLQPGVKKKMSEMSLEELRRKGSWAVRFYGRDKLWPLLDKKGQPTRFALTATAWGEPVPKTEAAARKIAAKGHRLLDRYHRLKDK